MLPAGAATGTETAFEAALPGFRTLNSSEPVVARLAAPITTVSCVELIKDAAVLTPFTRTTAFGAKFAPLT